MEKLKPLSSWKSRECRLEVELTQPAVARYRTLFPTDEKQLLKTPWVYIWFARESACEVRPEARTPATTNMQSFLNTAVCILLQTHYVNSPFDELAPEQVEERPGAIFLRASGELGMLLPRDRFHIETRTRGRGVLQADYSDAGLPTRLEQKVGETSFVVDEFEWDGRDLKSFWIFAGGERAFRHSQVRVASCR